MRLLSLLLSVILFYSHTPYSFSQTPEYRTELVKKRNPNKSFKLPTKRHVALRLEKKKKIYRGVFHPTSDSTFYLAKKKGGLVLNEQSIGNIESIRVKRKWQVIYTYTLAIWPFSIMGGHSGDFGEDILPGVIVITPFVAIITSPAWLIRYKYKMAKWDFRIYEVTNEKDKR